MNLILRGIKLLPNSNKKKINVILIIQLFKFILEIVGIGILIPVIYLLAKGETAVKAIIDKYNFLTIFPEYILGTNNLILFILTAVIIVSVIKFIFSIFSNLYEQKWLESGNVQTTCELFDFYIKDTSDLSTRENHNLIRNLTTEINNFYKFFIRGIIQCFGELIKLIGILIILLLINPKILFTGILLILVMGFVFYNYFKSKIEKYGRQKTLNSGLLIKHITEGLNSVKEIKLSENPNYFLNLMKKYANENAEVQVKFSMLGTYPRQILEILLIFIVCFFIYYLSILFPDQNSTSLFYLGVYVTAMLRMMPIVNMVYQSVQQISYAKSSFEVVEKEVHDNISKIKNADTQLAKTDKNIPLNSIEVKNLSFYYDNKEEIILENIDLRFEIGKIYCLNGRSGSGKSTLINLLMGFLKPTSGVISFNKDTDINKDLFFWQKNVSYLSQKVFLLNETIRKNIAFSQDEKDIDEGKIIKSLEKTNLLKHINKLHDGIQTIIGDDGIKLSGGQKQRVGIARSFYFNKKIIILDEFTSSLDLENENLIFDEISKEKKDKFIIIISHSQNIIDRSDIVLNVENKKIKLTIN